MNARRTALVAIAVVWTQRRRSEQPIPLVDEIAGEPGAESGDDEE